MFNRNEKNIEYDNELLLSGVKLLRSTALIDFPDRKPIFDKIKEVADNYHRSKYMPAISAAEFLRLYEILNKQYNAKKHIMNLNEV